MRLFIQTPDFQGMPTEAAMEHDGEVIIWNVGLFDKMSPGTNTYDIFEHINAFWAYQPKPTQDRIFAIYKAIRNQFDVFTPIDTLTEFLYNAVRDLLDLHAIEKVRHWVDFHSNIVLPAKAGLLDNIEGDNDAQRTPERTYLKEDYRQLIALTVALRSMIPIWGEYIFRIRKETGATFKEYYSLLLLSRSSIFHSEAMEKLRVYVEHSIPPEKSKSAAIFGGLSSEDFPIWMLAQVVVRRLAVGDIRGVDPTSSLVTFIYKYIGQKTKGHDTSFIGLVKDKVVEGQGQEGETNLSKLEGYKIKQEIPAGDIATLSYYMEDPLMVAQRICPDINLDLVRVSLSTAQELEFEQIWKPQEVLVQYVLSPVIPPRGIQHLKKALVIKAIGVTQALLWHRGYFDLAGLVSAVEQSETDEMYSGSDSRARIPKDLLEQLDLLFPFSRKLPGKKPGKRTNPAVEAVESLCTGFSERNWRLTLPDDWVEVVTGTRGNRRYIVPHDFKIKLAALVVAIGNRSF